MNAAQSGFSRADDKPPTTLMEFAWKALQLVFRGGGLWGVLAIGLVLAIGYGTWTSIVPTLTNYIQTQANVSLEMAKTLKELTALNAEDRERTAEFAMQVRGEHQQLKEAVLSNGTILTWAKESMKDVPAARAETNALLKELVEQRKTQP